MSQLILHPGQRDAIERVRRMQERARANLAASAGAEGPAEAPPPSSGESTLGNSVPGSATLGRRPQQGQGRQGRQGPPNRGPNRQEPPGLAGLLERIRSPGGFADEAANLGEGLNSALRSASEPLAQLLDAFDLDGEKLLILMVMWLIFREKGDKSLLLALGYLLL